MIDADTKEAVDKIVAKLADEGKLIEGGWTSYNAVVLDKDAPAIQRNECQLAFYAGAQHLWASIVGFVGGEDEPSEEDIDRMSKINDELQAFAQSMLALDESK